MRKIFKRATAIMLATIMVIGMTACGSSGKGNAGESEKTEASGKETGEAEKDLGDDPVTLNITMDQGSSNGLVALADAFMDKYPNVTINIYYLSWENVANSVSSGSKEEPVDGFMLSFREEMWTEKFLNVWKEKCEDFAETKIVDLDQFNKGVLDAVTTGENVYALPMATSTIGLITNEDLLKKCGINTQPQTIDELLKDCEIISKKGYKPFQCTQLSLSYMITAIAYYEMQAEGRSQEYIETALNKKDAAIGKYYKNAIDLVTTLIEKGYLDFKAEVYNPELNDEAGGTEVIGDYKDECYAFLNGDVAFYPIYSDLMSSLQKREIKSQAYLDNPFVYDMIPVPTVDGPSSIQTASYSLYVCKESENYDWMNRFIQFTFDENENSAVGNVSYFSDNQYSMSSKDTKENATEISRKYYSSFLDLYEKETPCPVDYDEILEYHGYGICTGPLVNLFRDEDIANMNSDQLESKINAYMKDWFVNGNIKE